MIVQSVDTGLVISRPERSTTLLIGTHPFPQLGCASCRAGDPQGFLVAMHPNTRIDTHFHPVDQFQVVVDGRGTVGRHAVAAGSVHYADRLMPYGPITADADGLTYLTLRCESDAGAEWMPASRERLRSELADAETDAAGRRHFTVDFDARSGTEANGWSVRVDDGERVAMAHIAAGDELAGLERGGRGGFVVVIDGDVTISGHEQGDTPNDPCVLRRGSLVHFDGDDRATRFRADTAALLVDVQFRSVP